ncbi:hypothetical protein BV22DRAFT_1127575 [Leucogyrophana mollusca]|uniref:Uncharacterized protein n=1 Tax=Leucogyrophana mollusca TaxID=85980 RepID=A0ACB8BNK0_9AGAM|nr:hypothetical protein BV22DRAFT_1127575 [Leucogyrophana mollusca]
MRWTNALVYATLSGLTAYASQFPVGAPDTEDSHIDVPRGDYGSHGRQWRFDETPAVNATGHLVFETVSSLLQHWPNTRYRNGHTLVPGVVPPGTLLYHGTTQKVVPNRPEWLATDPEHSHVFCRGTVEAGCWHLTLATTRPLHVLYLDGSSAAKMKGGPMDSQDIVAWGEFRDDWTFNERQRIVDLCEWGQQYSLDGFLRMEQDFEVMLCNFTSGVKVASFLNLPDLSIIDRGKPPSQVFRTFEMMNGGHWHNRYPGEGRAHLDLSRLISFYDVDLVPSLVAQRFGQERWDHRLSGADAADIVAVRARLADVLTEKQTSSGVDWRTLFHVIVDRYADRLELLQYLINDTDTRSESRQDSRERAAKAQLQLRIMLTPYILHSSVPSSHSEHPTAGFSWAEPVFRECATMHTDIIVTDFTHALTPSERLLLQAIQETTREICRVVVRMWAEGVETGLDSYLPMKAEVPDVTAVMAKWSDDLNGLMAWLDWSIYQLNDRFCSQEMCYLPTWPVGFQRRRRPDQPPEPEDDEEWKRPQPKCIRRVDPYGF